MTILTRMRRAQRAWNSLAAAELAGIASATRSNHEPQPRGQADCPSKAPQGREARQGKVSALLKPSARAGQDDSCGHYHGLDNPAACTRWAQAAYSALIDDCACQIKDPMNARQQYEHSIEQQRRAQEERRTHERRMQERRQAQPLWRPAIEGPYTRTPLWELIGIDVIVAVLLTLLAVHELHHNAPLSWPAVTIAGALVLFVRVAETAITFRRRRQ